MNTEYSGQKVIDFLQKDSFTKWASSTPSFEYEQWELYFRENPGFQTEMVAARRFILEIKNAQSLDKDLENQIWGNINNRTFKPISFFRSAAFRVAASIILLLSLLSYGYIDNRKKNEKFAFRNEKNKIENSTGKINRLELHDGTIIDLLPESKISYPDNYNLTERIVYLEGEAFFDVSKNPNKPFYVISNNMVTKVLGTSFLVSAKKGSSENSVSVKTGKVEVLAAEDYERSWFSKETKEKILLEPNQKAVFSISDNSLSKTLVEVPVQVTRQTKEPVRLNFDNTSADEVLKRLSRAFNIEINYNSESFKNCLLTVDLENEGLYASLDIICKTLNANYRIVETHVIIEGKGCKF